MKKIPTLKVSGWAIAVAVCILVSTTYALLEGYSRVHWELMRNALHVQDSIEAVTSNAEAMAALDSKEQGEEIRSLKDRQGKVVETGWELMSFFGIYHLTGIAAFVLSLLAFFCKPRWLILITLPVGIIGFIQAGVIM